MMMIIIMWIQRTQQTFLIIMIFSHICYYFHPLCIFCLLAKGQFLFIQKVCLLGRERIIPATYWLCHHLMLSFIDWKVFWKFRPEFIVPKDIIMEIIHSNWFRLIVGKETRQEINERDREREKERERERERERESWGRKTKEVIKRSEKKR